MLVITRHKEESFFLRTPQGQVIKIQVIEIRGPKTRLGIEAPQDVDIWREELGDFPRRTTRTP